MSWKIEERCGGLSIRDDTPNGDNVEVCFIGGNELSDHDRENGKIIVNAPEMYKALVNIMKEDVNRPFSLMSAGLRKEIFELMKKIIK